MMLSPVIAADRSARVGQYSTARRVVFKIV
jgi:hypothetical protein